jgi:glyoxylase-like metal-dependent hydrolase (beta-lactamase superfamily II)
MFGIIPKPLWEKEVPADCHNRIKMVTRSLLLVSTDRKIIIDTGNGEKWQKKFRDIYDIDTKTVSLNSSLKHHGYSPEEITDVFCTHLHFDHAGGNTRLDRGKVVPTFPNATYWIQNENWELANSPSEKDQGSFMSDDWSVLVENNMIKFVDGKDMFLPGIGVHLTYGHTTGMMHPIIQDNSNTIIYMADLIPMAAHIPLPWVMAYDLHPAVTVQEKKEILPKIVKEGWMIFFEHDPIHQACTVQFNGKHFQLSKSVTISE